MPRGTQVHVLLSIAAAALLTLAACQALFLALNSLPLFAIPAPSIIGHQTELAPPFGQA